MKKLLKDLDFTTEYQYFEYIIESYINGQKKQAKELFQAMPLDKREYFILEWLDQETNCDLDLVSNLM